MSTLFKIIQKQFITKYNNTYSIPNNICLLVDNINVDNITYQIYLKWITNYKNYNIYIYSYNELDNYVKDEFNYSISLLFSKLDIKYKIQLFTILWVYLNGGWILKLKDIPLKNIITHQLKLIFAKKSNQYNNISYDFLAGEKYHPFLEYYINNLLLLQINNKLPNNYITKQLINYYKLHHCHDFFPEIQSYQPDIYIINQYSNHYQVRNIHLFTKNHNGISIPINNYELIKNIYPNNDILSKKIPLFNENIIYDEYYKLLNKLNNIDKTNIETNKETHKETTIKL